ncbi:Mitochondrial import inner membrane translocase subunit TIM44-2 [Linum perenne]
MAARKLVRDLLLARQPVLQQFKSPQGLSTTSRLLVDNRWSSYRRFGVFNNVKEEANRTKQTAEKLYRHVDGVWSEAEATAKKVSSSVKEKISAATEEIAEDMRERWETSDNPIVHKIQDYSAGDTIFQETDTASSIKEIRRRDPSFSLPDFVAEVQDAIRPVLHAYMKGDTETLKKYCSPEVISRCEGEHKAFKSHGMFFDNRLLHVSEVEVRETKMMGTSPIIIVAFQTQQIHCVRDSAGKITEGGQDTIHTVYYAWAMQQVEPQELGEGAIYPIWRLREMQQIGVQALI